jgi:cell division protein FtsB
MNFYFNKVKRIAVKVLFMGEILVFGHMYFFGKNGIEVLREQQKKVTCMNESVVQLAGDVARVEKEIATWKEHDFFKEKIAREQLQMARKGDQLFYIG